MSQIEIRPPTTEAQSLSLEIMDLFELKDADVSVAHEAMLWTLVLSAGLNAGAITSPPPDFASEEGAEQYERMVKFFTSLRLLTAGLIRQL